MKVKKFIAPTMQEAMKQVRNELGKDAVILNSKVVQKGGLLGLFTKKQIEVIAAIDTKQSMENRQTKKINPVRTTTKETDVVTKPVQKEVTSNHELREEINEMKQLIRNISINESSLPLPEPIQRVSGILEEQELSKGFKQEIIASLLEKWYVKSTPATFTEVVQWSQKLISDIFREYQFGTTKKLNKKYINVVGPTGVGKTTTLAKIAADAVINEKKKVAFITTDTYRIAAIEQLKTYAKIFNVPLEVCYSIEDFNRAKVKFEEFDTVFIDTAGRNFRNRKYVEDLNRVIDFNHEMNTYLVLSLTSKLQDMKEIYNQFSLINIDQVIFTKIDETSTYGAMVNFLLTSKLGLSYITNGQNVPEDLEKASPEMVANLILGVEKK